MPADPQSASRVVHSEVEAGIATITLDSVANRNALSARLVSELLDALAAASADPAVHAVVITGAGTVFCSGADLTDPPTNDSGSRFSYPDVLEAILACPKVVVARVNGHTRAGGLGIIAASDIAIATGSATFAFSEVRIGLAPAIISVVCQPVMAPRALSRYALTGETFTASIAADIGLLTMVAADGELDVAVAALLAEIRRTEPNSVARTKSLLRELPGMPSYEAFPFAASASVALFDSAEGREGIAAFREKRPPFWAW